MSAHACWPQGKGQRSSMGKSSPQIMQRKGGGLLNTPEMAESTALAKRRNVPEVALEAFGTLEGRSRCGAAMETGLA